MIRNQIQIMIFIILTRFIIVLSDNGDQFHRIAMATFLLSACRDVGFDMESTWKACFIFRKFSDIKADEHESDDLFGAACMWTVSKHTEMLVPAEPRLRDILCSTQYFHSQQTGTTLPWPIEMEEYWSLRDKILHLESILLTRLKHDLRVACIDGLEFFLFNQAMGNQVTCARCWDVLDIRFAVGMVEENIDSWTLAENIISSIDS